MTTINGVELSPVAVEIEAYRHRITVWFCRHRDADLLDAFKRDVDGVDDDDMQRSKLASWYTKLNGIHPMEVRDAS